MSNASMYTAIDRTILKQRDEMSRNIVWYLPIYTCRVGGKGESVHVHVQGAEKLVFLRDRQPFFPDAKILKSEGIRRRRIE
jgi:hypothetical protein